MEAWLVCNSLLFHYLFQYDKCITLRHYRSPVPEYIFRVGDLFYWSENNLFLLCLLLTQMTNVSPRKPWQNQKCWTITSDIEKKIEAAEMWFIRRMLRISWTEKKTNVNVLREGNVQRSLLKTIRKRQMEFLGHVCRRRGLEFLSLTGKVEGKRDRGKQRITFLDSLCNSATGGQSKGLNFLKLSDDRDVWRGMVANVCSRSGTWWWSPNQIITRWN